MAITFVVEDGTGKTDSTSYATVAQYRQYWENRGVDRSATSVDDVEAKLNIATEYLDNTYNWEGVPGSGTQSLNWPRVGVEDPYGYAVDSDSIPQKIIDAACYLADQNNLAAINNGIQSFSIGPISKTFGKSGGLPSFPVVERLIEDYLMHGVKMIRVN